jgi:hypothetical protein
MNDLIVYLLSFVDFMVRKRYGMISVLFCSPAREPGRHGCEDDLLQPHPTPLLSRHLSGWSKLFDASYTVVVFVLSNFVVLNNPTGDQDPDPNSVPDPDLVPDPDSVPDQDSVPDPDLVTYLGFSAGSVKESASEPDSDSVSCLYRTRL